MDYIYHVFHPTVQDVIASLFDLMFVWTGISNLRSLIRDKQVKGFDWKNVFLYIGWNIFTIFVIYPGVNFYLANVLTIIYLFTQLLWLTLLAKFTLER